MSSLLIIDDSKLVRDEVAKSIEKSSLFSEIIFASNGAEGMEKLMTIPIDLVICDVNMPVMDGFKFLSLVGNNPKFKRIPILMLTGEDTLQDKLKSFELGARDYVMKPHKDAELLARVRAHLSIKKLQDELNLKNEELKQLSITDALTKVYNRRYLIEQIEKEFMRAKRFNAALAFLMIDIDHFKRFNDTYGHHVGDEVIVMVAAMARTDIRNIDTLGRYGGEEFGVILPQTNRQGAVTVAEKIRRDIQDAALASEYTEEKLHVEISIGVASFPELVCERVDELMQAADNALYMAKEGGRNKVAAV